jgi:CBS domain-containing protein
VREVARARDIMTADVVTVEGSASVAEAVKLMKERAVRALIVERRSEDDAYGIVTQRDVVYGVVAEGRDPSSVKIHEIMSKPLVVVNPDLDVKYVARLMAQRGLSRAPVLFGQKLQGVVSISDIIEKAM